MTQSRLKTFQSCSLQKKYCNSEHRVLFQNVLSREQKNKQGNNVGGVQELSVHSQKKAKSKVMYYKAP